MAEDPDDLATPNALNLFNIPQKSCGIERVDWVDFRPIAPLAWDQAIEYNITGSGHQFIDLKRSFLHVKAKITRTEGGSIDSGDIAVPVNLWLHSLYSQCDVSMQQKLLYNSGNLYAYKAYIETIMNNAESDYDGLATEMFYKDSAGEMDHVSTKDRIAINVGSLRREQRSKDSKLIDMIGPLHADICQMDRLIINGVDISIKLYPSKPSFNLMSKAAHAPAFKPEIVSTVLKVCKVTIDPSILAAQSAVLAKGITVKYPIEKTELKSFVIPQNQLSFYQSDIFQNKVPTTLVIGIVNARAFQGDYTRSPYNFDTFGLNKLAVYWDGTAVPFKPLQLNYEHGEYLQAYKTLIDESYKCGVTHREFAAGYALYVYNLSDTKCTPKPKDGNLSIEGSFDTPLTESVNIIIYAKFPGLIQVDQYRSVSL